MLTSFIGGGLCPSNRKWRTLSIYFIIRGMLALQIHPSSGCVFRVETVSLTADLMYNLILEDTDMCIRSCYDESGCISVMRDQVCAKKTGLLWTLHFQDLCSLYKQGSTVHTPTGRLYALKRQESDPSGRILEMAPAIAFKPIPTQNIQAIETCDSNPEVTTIQIYLGNGLHFYFPASSRVHRDFSATRRYPLQTFGFWKYRPTPFFYYN